MTLAADVQAAGYEVLACGNLVIGKEITLLARPSPNEPAAPPRAAQPDAARLAKRNLAWLNATLQLGEQLAGETHPFGVFGTSIAGVGSAMESEISTFTPTRTNCVLAAIASGSPSSHRQRSHRALLFLSASNLNLPQRSLFGTRHSAAAWFSRSP